MEQTDQKTRCISNMYGMLMLRAKKKNKSGKGNRIRVGVIKVLTGWSGMALLRRRRNEEMRRGAMWIAKGSVFQAKGTANS